MTNKKYKIVVLLIKYSTWFLAFCYFMNTILMYFKIYLSIISWITFTSLSTIVILYFMSLLLNFCIWHRLPLYYIFICNIIDILSWFSIIFIKPSLILFITIVLFGFLILLGAYLKNKYNEKNRSSKSMSS